MQLCTFLKTMPCTLALSLQEVSTAPNTGRLTRIAALKMLQVTTRGMHASIPGRVKKKKGGEGGARRAEGDRGTKNKPPHLESPSPWRRSNHEPSPNTADTDTEGSSWTGSINRNPNSLSSRTTLQSKQYVSRLGTPCIDFSQNGILHRTSLSFPSHGPRIDKQTNQDIPEDLDRDCRTLLELLGRRQLASNPGLTPAWRFPCHLGDIGR